MKNWHSYKNILIIRADNMGDLIMSTPALRALKETYNYNITVLTSKMGSVIAKHVDYIDDCIVYDAPWMKNISANNIVEKTNDILDVLKKRNFDAAIIFTVYSQSPLPAAMLALLAGIPERLAYCRENPYNLLTQWIPDKEPYTFIQHQVKRDLKLTEHIGAFSKNIKLSLNYSFQSWKKAKAKLAGIGIDTAIPFIIFHPGVSDEKRQYPIDLWIQTIRLFAKRFSYNILITGNKTEKNLADEIKDNTSAFSIADLLRIDEFIALVDKALGVVTVNTGTVHIAAAMQTPVVVLYAQTNPQHTPWNVPNVVLPFSINKHLQSKNEVVQYVNDKLYSSVITYPMPAQIISSFKMLLNEDIPVS